MRNPNKHYIGIIRTKTGSSAEGRLLLSNCGLIFINPKKIFKPIAQAIQNFPQKSSLNSSLKIFVHSFIIFFPKEGLKRPIMIIDPAKFHQPIANKKLFIQIKELTHDHHFPEFFDKEFICSGSRFLNIFAIKLCNYFI